MKQLLFIALLASFSIISFAQTAATQAFEFETSAGNDKADNVRLHFFYSTGSVFNYRLLTSLQPDTPIKLKPNSYVILETDVETIHFFQNDAVNNLPLQLKFEKGNDYYFRINRSVDGVWWGINIDEMTERAFQMQIFANNSSPKPEVHSFLSESALN